MLASTARRVVSRCPVRVAASDRTFFTGVFSDHAGQIDLTQELAGVPTTQPCARQTGPVQVSKLDNGLTVASQETEYPLASIGVYVDAGSRTEDAATEGISYTLSRVAFKSTQARSHLGLVRDSENAGLSLSSVSSREDLVYAGEGIRTGTEELVELLGESVTAPLLPEWEMEAWQDKVGEYDAPIIESDINIALSEATHAAAFLDDTPLGHSSFVSGTPAFSSDDLRAFITSKFSANRMVVAATGVDHNELVNLVNQQFGGVPAGDASTVSGSAYVGGEVRSKASTGVAAYSVSFSAPSLASSAADKATIAVLEALLGATVPGHAGVGSRQSRLALAEASDASIGVASAFTRQYRDAGLFGVYAAADAEHAGNSFAKVAAALKGLTTVSGDELTRAKNQAIMGYLTAVESSSAARDNIGRQLLLTGAHIDAKGVVAAINAVTADNVKSVAGSLLSSTPTVAAVGDIGQVPRYAEAAALFQ